MGRVPAGCRLTIRAVDRKPGAECPAQRGAPIDGIDLPGKRRSRSHRDIFRAATPGPVQNGTSTPVHGDGFALAVEFSQPMKTKSLVSYGDCSQPGCKHHTDQPLSVV